MKIIRLGAAVLVGSLAIAAAAPAAAVTTTLNFAGNICGAAGNQACSDYSQIGQNYGDGTGVDVSYRSYDTTTNATSEAFLKFWNTGYGDLQRIVWGGFGPNGYASEITFAALAGYELRILGFDGACYQNRASCQSFPYSITEIGGGTAASGAVTPASGSHDSFTFNTGYSTSGYVLSWGPDGYDGGLDNIAFDVRAVSSAVVPEPSAWALMILGFGLVGGAMRTRARVKFVAA